MNRTLDNIGLPKYPSSMEELLAIDDPNIHYTAHQFWEQDGPRNLLLDMVKKLSGNESGN